MTPREIDLFLTNSPYAQFVAGKVIRNACTRFAMLPEDERRSVFAIALLHGSDAAGVVREIVAYMRNRP
ncbi:MAG: hypothetical protein LC635_05825 [Pseudonocardiaceae bacterium]|nr:hypothetical protein [Pseudonocardiaceae bacterium]